MARQKNTIGPKVIVDGEAEFRKAIKDIENTMKTLNSEMKVVTSQFDKNDNSVEALTARNTVLNKLIEEQRKKLEELQKGLNSATTSYGATDERTQEWQRDLNNATAKLNDMERQLRINTETINKNESATDNLGDEVEDLGKEFKEAENKALTFGDVLKANVIGDVITSGLRKVGSVLKESITDGIQLASDLAESQNVVDVTFGENAKTIDEWAKTLDTAFGMSELSAKQYVGTMGAMLKSMQLTDDQVLTMSQSLVQLAGDMASFYNIDVETAFNKLRSGISGETEPLKQLGINLSVANLEAFALAEGIEKSYSKMTQAEQATLRYNYLMKVTADAQGDFARTSDSLANQQRILDLQLENLEITMGKKVVPTLTSGLSKINAKIDESGEALANVAGGALEAVTDGMLFVIDNAEPIISGIAGITAGLAVFKVGAWVQTGVTAVVASWKAYKTATEGATVAQWAMNAAQSASPIGLLATGIGLLTAGLTAYAFTANDATEATSQLNKEVEESNQTIESNIKSREDNIKSIESEYGAAQKLADTLYDLADKTNKTSTEKAQMASLVEQLNKAIPDLNLNIDKETGALSKQRDEVNKLITANLEYYKVKAAQESLTKIATDIYTEEENLRKLEEAKPALVERQAEAYKKWESAVDAAKYTQNGWTIESVKATEALGDANKALNDHESKVNESKNKLNDLNNEWEKANDFIKRNSAALETNTDKVKESAQATKTLLSDVTDSLKVMLQEYHTAVDEQTKKIKESMGLFDEFALKTDMSGQKLLKNLQSQVDGIAKWAENLKTLAKRGIDEGLLEELRNMGPTAASEINALTQLSDSELQKYVDLWKEKSKLASDIAKEQMSGMSGALIYEAGSLHRQLNETGKNAIQGFADGMKSKESEVKRTLKDIIDGVVRQCNVTLEIQSPSKVFKRMGAYSAEGYEVGWKDKMSSARRAIAESLRTITSPTTTTINDATIRMGSANASISDTHTSSTIDYSLMSNALISALQRLNLVVMVDEDKLGEIVDNRVGKVMTAQ